MIGLKTCSLPLSHSEFLHLNLRLVDLILPKNISDMSQKCPIRLLALNLLPLIMSMITLSAVNRSTRIGLFVIKQNPSNIASAWRARLCSFEE
jgi:hypothetical protein